MEGGPPMKCRNYQEIKIQEQVQRLAVGTIPRSMWVVLMDDLVDTCKPGDDVTVWYVVVVWMCSSSSKQASKLVRIFLFGVVKNSSHSFSPC